MNEGVSGDEPDGWADADPGRATEPDAVLDVAAAPDLDELDTRARGYARDFAGRVDLAGLRVRSGRLRRLGRRPEPTPGRCCPPRRAPSPAI